MDKTEKILIELESMLDKNEITNNKIQEEISEIIKNVRDNKLNLNDFKHNQNMNEDMNEIIAKAVQQIESHK